jgi:prolyl oligopeptidase
MLHLERGQGPVLLKRAPRTFSAAGLVVSRHEAASVDGERIPYVQVGPARETGDAPIHLYGYGGFEISELPTYDSAIGKLWLEGGGTSVVANIRGGGEFGARWRQAGRREGKRLSRRFRRRRGDHAPWSHRRRPHRREGSSNNGILITSMLVRYPSASALLCDPFGGHAPLQAVAGAS